MKFPLTDEVAREARRYQLRSACGHCLFHVAAEDRCAHEWPDEDQKRWPPDAPDADGRRPDSIAFCKEFELR